MVDREYWLECRHGYLETPADTQALNVLTRTVNGLADHGEIRHLVTMARNDRTRWIFESDDAGTLQGLVDLAWAIAPDYWRVEWSPVVPTDWPTTTPTPADWVQP